MRPVVLVVDDDPAGLEALTLVLGTGYIIRTASDGRTALQLARQQPVDVVLLDILMPGMDGLEVLAQLKAAQPLTEVILLTGMTQTETAVRGMQLGAADYITKPFKADRLLQSVDRSVQRRRTETGRVLLVGSRPEALAPLEVVLRLRVSAAMTSLRRATDARFEGQGPALIVFDSGQAVSTATEGLPALRNWFPRAKLLLMTSDVNGARREASLSLLPPGALVGKPYRLDDLLERIAILLAVAGEPRVSWSRFPPALLRAIDYISAGYRQPLNSEKIATAAELSASRLAHVFRDTLAMTIREFINQLRVSISRYLLAETNKSLSEIALAVGFSDASHLSRVFTFYQGIRPGEYRRQVAALRAERGRLA